MFRRIEQRERTYREGVGGELLSGRKGDVGRKCCCYYERLFYFIMYQSPGYLKGLPALPGSTAARSQKRRRR